MRAVKRECIVLSPLGLVECRIKARGGRHEPLRPAQQIGDEFAPASVDRLMLSQSGRPAATKTSNTSATAAKYPARVCRL